MNKQQKTVDEAAQECAYANSIYPSEGWNKRHSGIEFGFKAAWQQGQSDPTHIGVIVRQTLEYVAEHSGELFYSDNNDELKYGLMTMHPEIVNNIINSSNNSRSSNNIIKKK